MPSRKTCNYKSTLAKAAKEELRKERNLEEEKRKEALLWKDDVTESKLNKKESLLQKQQEKLQRKLENKKLAEEESNQLKTSNKKSTTPTKISRADILQKTLASSLKASMQVQSPEPFLLENPNHAASIEEEIARNEGVELISASGVSDFLDKISGPTSVDRSVEKRLKAAFAVFEQKQYDILKEEYPNMKRSQYKNKIWKMWIKSPENPANQTLIN